MVASRRPALGLPNTGTFGANARYVLRSVDDAGKAQYGLQEVQAGSHRGSKSYHEWMGRPPEETWFRHPRWELGGANLAG